MKGSWKRVMSGVLSVLTIATTVFQPITTYAAEPDNTASSFESQYPELETVKDKQPVIIRWNMGLILTSKLIFPV